MSTTARPAAANTLRVDRSVEPGLFAWISLLTPLFLPWKVFLTAGSRERKDSLGMLDTGRELQRTIGRRGERS